MRIPPKTTLVYATMKIHKSENTKPDGVPYPSCLNSDQVDFPTKVDLIMNRRPNK